ncbi:MAG: hypothetical protein OXI01_11165 [Albidovulum sp.]|nr:hypothetical protein [Albidovulum sp.]
MRAGLDAPERAALAYRSFVREVVRRCALERKEFNPALPEAMAGEAGIPDADRAHAVDCIGREFRSLREGNAIR